MEAPLSARIEACERANRRLARALSVQSLALVAIVASCVTARPPDTPRALRVTELVVVDPQGIERVRIGGDLPDAIIGGRRVPRGEKAAGVLLYDRTGTERGGYVTWEPSGNVGLTLDSRTKQVALFVADAEEGSALQLWHGRDAIELRSDDNGSRLTGVKQGRVVFQEPAITDMGAEMCAVYREARSRVSAEQVLQDCGRRFVESACRACLDAQ